MELFAGMRIVLVKKLIIPKASFIFLPRLLKRCIDQLVANWFLQATYFQPLIDKISSCINGWQQKLLYMEGRHSLIKHVLNSIPMHILSAISLPKQTIQEIEQLLTKVLWVQHEQEDKRYWMF